MINSVATSAYVDTNIVSGLVREDLAPNELTALDEIIRHHKRGTLRLITSSILKEEIDRIPAEYRRPHETIYNLLSDIPTLPKEYNASYMTPTSVWGGITEDSVYSELKQLLPDDYDAQHIFQAIKNNIAYFLTADRRTILRHRAELESRYGIRAVSPVELLGIISA